MEWYFLSVYTSGVHSGSLIGNLASEAPMAKHNSSPGSYMEGQ